MGVFERGKGSIILWTRVQKMDKKGEPWPGQEIKVQARGEMLGACGCLCILCGTFKKFCFYPKCKWKAVEGKCLKGIVQKGTGDDRIQSAFLTADSICVVRER